MKKLTQEEYDQIEVRRSSPVIREVKVMKIGDHLLVNKEDWHVKTSISSYICNKSYNPKKFSINVLSDKSGWVITRKA